MIDFSLQSVYNSIQLLRMSFLCSPAECIDQFQIPQKELYMYQQITIIGNVGRDPEMRYTPSGVPVTNFSVAVNESWTSEDGQRHDKTIWFRVSAWRRQAEICNQYLTKGRRVLVVGEMQEPNVWTDQSGSPRAGLDMTARLVRFLNTRAESEALASDTDQAGESAAPAGSEEDIPF